MSIAWQGVLGVSMDKNQASWYIGSEFFRISYFCLFSFHAYSNDEFAGASVARRASPLSAMPSKTSIITIFSPSEKSSMPRSLILVSIWHLLIDILVYQSFSALVMCPCDYKRNFKTSSIQLNLKLASTNDPLAHHRSRFPHFGGCS